MREEFKEEGAMQFLFNTLVETTNGAMKIKEDLDEHKKILRSTRTIANQYKNELTELKLQSRHEIALLKRDLEIANKKLEYSTQGRGTLCNIIFNL